MDGASFSSITTPPLPPDRASVATEQRHPHSHDLDALGIEERVRLMADDHQAVIDAVTMATESLAQFIEALADRMRHGGRLIYAGAGTSGRLGVLDASECPPTFQSEPNQVIGLIAGGDAALRQSSEGREDQHDGAIEALAELNLSSGDTLLGIAAGGTTPYVLGAISYASRCAAMTGLLTCSPPLDAQLPCGHVILLQTGPEILTGSTRLKAGSATKLALNIITTSVFTELGKVHGNLMVDMRASNDKLLDRAIRTLQAYQPALTRDQAALAVDAADGSLKTAIVMQRCNLSRAAAAELLDRHNGHLRPIIGEI